MYKKHKINKNNDDTKVNLTSVNKLATRLSAKKHTSGPARNNVGQFTTGQGGLSAFKKFKWGRALPLIISVALVGGYLVYRGFAATPVPAPSEFVARTYTEALGRIPSQSEWNKWQVYYRANGCTSTTLSKLLSEVYSSSEYSALPYSNNARVVSLYRSTFSREPDSGGYEYWKKQMDSGKKYSDVAAAMVQSTEFTRLSARICNNQNYEFLGKPFVFSGSRTGDQIQALIDATRSGGVVELMPGEVVSVDRPILVKRGVTLTTKGSVGIAGRSAYLNMARLVVGGPNRESAPVVVMPGATVKNVWVDGQMWQKKTKDQGKNNIRIYPTNTVSKLEYVRSDNTTAAQNVMVFGIVGSEYTSKAGQEYRSDGVCGGQPEVTGNLIINSANIQLVDRWSDGIATSCHNTKISGNEILDASDVAIIAYRTYGQYSQKSQIVGNKVLSAGNSIFAGIAADPLSLKSQQLQPFPQCATHETEREPNCDFNGLLVKDNLLWSGTNSHYIIGISVGTRAFGFFQPDATTGTGASFVGNGNGYSGIRAVVPLYVSGMNNATVRANFTTGNLTPVTDPGRSCKRSAVQLYNPAHASNLSSTNIQRQGSSSDLKYLIPVTGQASRDKCI